VVLRAHDDETGVVAWERTIPAVSIGRMEVIAGRVVVAGTRLTASGSALGPYVGVFRLKTGALVWQDVGPLGGYQGLAVRDGRIIVAGTAFNQVGQGTVLVRAFELSTGAALWAGAAALRPGESDAVRAVAVTHAEVIVVGSRGLAAVGLVDRAVVVQAYR
jgi:outer membrane protein assembly factor BamB